MFRTVRVGNWKPKTVGESKQNHIFLKSERWNRKVRFQDNDEKKAVTMDENNFVATSDNKSQKNV